MPYSPRATCRRLGAAGALSAALACLTLPSTQAAPAKPVTLPYTLRDGGVQFTLLGLTRGGSRTEPGVQARLRVTAGGARRTEWQPAALRLHVPGRPPLEPSTIYTVPGADLDLRFQAPLPPAAKAARLEVEFRRQQGFPADRQADFSFLSVPRRMGSVQTYTRKTALGQIELRVIPARLTVPRAGDPSHYLEVIVKRSASPAPKAAAGAVRPGKLYLRVVRATAERLPVTQLLGQMVTLEAKTEKYLIPFRLASGERELSVALALDRGKNLFFPSVQFQRPR